MAKRAMFEAIRIAIKSLFSGDPVMVFFTGFGLLLVSGTSTGSRLMREDVRRWRRVPGQIVHVEQERKLIDQGYQFIYEFELDGERYTRNSKVSLKSIPQEKSVLVYVNPKSRYDSCTELELQEGTKQLNILGYIGVVVIAIAGLLWLIKKAT